MAKRVATSWMVASSLVVSALVACGDASSDAAPDGTGGAGAGSAGTTSSVGGASTSTGVGAGAQGGAGATGGQGGGGEGGTGGGSGELCPSTAFFCDDFEQGSIGDVPAGEWDPDSQGVISADHAHSGSHAVRLDEGFNFQKLPLANAPDVLYARVLMWSEFQGDTADSRYSIQSMATDSGHEANIDSNGQILVIHHYPGGESGIDGTLAVPTNQWTCVETSFDRTTRTFRSWVDGVEALELADPASTEDIPDPWTLFQLSGVVYHGGTTVQYYDDVALSTEPIGCP